MGNKGALSLSATAVVAVSCKVKVDEENRSTIGGRGEIRRFRPLGCHQNSPYWGQDYMVDNLGPNWIIFTRDWSNMSPGGDIFVKTEGKIQHLPPPSVC